MKEFLGPKLALALICTLCLLIGISIGVSGGHAFRRGPGPRRGPPKGGPVGALTERLGLDEAQAKAVGKIFERYGPEFEKVEEQRRERLREVRDRCDADMREVLDDEQFEGLLELRRELERRERRGPGGRGPRGPGGPGGPGGPRDPGGPGGPPPGPPR